MKFISTNSRRLSALPAGIVAGVVVALAVASPSRAQTLLHQYVFNGNVNDVVGSANGVLVNGATAAGGVLTLNGVDQSVQFSSFIVPTSGSYSVSVFAAQAVVQNGFVELISQGSSGGPGFYLGHDPSNVIRATDSWTNTGASFASDTARHLYTLTVNAGTGISTLFVDGVQKNTLAGAITTTTSGSNTALGKQFGGSSEFFGGQLQDVRIYSGALSSGQVSALNAAGPSLSASAPEPVGLALLPFALPAVAAFRRRRKA